MAGIRLLVLATALLVVVPFGVASATTDPLAHAVNTIGEVNGVYPSDGQTASPWRTGYSIRFVQRWPGGRGVGHVSEYHRDVRASSAQTAGVQSSAIRFAGVAGPRWVLKHAARLLDPGEQTFTSRLHTVGQEAVYVTTSNSHDATGTIVFRRGHYCGWVKVVRGGESGPPLGSVEALATEVDRRLHRLR